MGETELRQALMRAIPAASDLERRDELILWLAMAYHGNSPCFRLYKNPDDSGDGAYEPTPLQERLERTWEEIVGPVGPTDHAGWWQCPECAMWQLVAAPIGGE